MIHVYLDNVEYFIVQDLDKFDEVIERDESFGGIVPKFPKNIIFNESAFEYLYGKLIDEGYCRQVAIRMTNDCDGALSEIVSGHIILSDIKFDFDSCSADCPIVDDSAISFIFANKDLKVSLTETKSKDGTALSASNLANQFLLTMHNPATGVANGNFLVSADRYVYDIRDALQFLVSYITNQSVTFESDFLDNLPANRRLCICHGFDIRGSTVLTPAPEFSFNEVFSALRKLFNVGFVIIRQNGIVIFKLEKIDDLFNTTVAINLNKIPGISQKTDTAKIFASVDSGDTKAVVVDGAIHSVPLDTYLDFQKHNYIIDSVCNVSKIQNLKNDYFIIDSNIIEQLLIGVFDDNGIRVADESFDYDPFIIQYDNTGFIPPFSATKGNYVAGKFPYNEEMINKNVIFKYGYTDNPDTGKANNNIIFDREKDRIINISFEFPISDEDWQALKASPHYAISISNEKKSFTIWIRKFSRNINTSLCSCEGTTSLKYS